jgi:hypothetical protein
MLTTPAELREVLERQLHLSLPEHHGVAAVLERIAAGAAPSS